ncbi:D-alanine--D-alanine ligase [Candidatus Roizmanbacteria bacterium]|nr:D-alanine--D-alanine ligase [Candidatus Roizmanbacteria bacterium]
MKTIGVFFGSRSPEHDVSILTGQLIISGLKKCGYNVIPVYIDKKGKWYSDARLASMKFFTQNPTDLEKKLESFNIDFNKSSGKMVKQSGFMKGNVVFDIAFPAFHGQNGEDGTFQGLCEILNVPYVGCDVTSSAITMDKVLTKMIYKANNIPTVDFVYFNLNEWRIDKKKVIQQIKSLNFPLIIKPARLGSSIGISKAKNQKELEFAIEVALHYDEKVIVEKAVEDLMDVTCCLIGNDNPTPSLLQESVFSSGFFSYEDKYLKGGGAQTGNATKSIIIPARLNSKITREIQDAAKKAYLVLGCSGITRVDFLYDKKSAKWYANEVNTLPGTLYHHLWKASGVPFEELLKKLIGFAEEKYQKKKQITYTFNSNILTQASSNKLSLKGI